jgi:hypothetical protein
MIKVAKDFHFMRTVLYFVAILCVAAVSHASGSIANGHIVDVQAYDGDLAVASANAHGKTILISSVTKTLTSDLTIPRDESIIVAQGGLIVTGTSPLTISGPFSAGLYQVFSGSGPVRGLKTVYPEWWGATGTGTTNDDYAFNKAVTCANLISGQVIVTNKYLISNIILPTSNGILFKGVQPNDSRIITVGTGTAISIGSNSTYASNVTFEDLFISGGNKPAFSTMIGLYNAAFTKFKNVHINCTTAGSTIFRLDYSMATDFDHVVISGAVRSALGIDIDNDSDGTMVHNMSNIQGGDVAGSIGMRINGLYGHAITTVENNIFQYWATNIRIAVNSDVSLVQIRNNIFDKSDKKENEIVIGQGDYHGREILIENNYFLGGQHASEGIHLITSDRVHIRLNRFLRHLDKSVIIGPHNSNFIVMDNESTDKGLILVDPLATNGIYDDGNGNLAISRNASFIKSVNIRGHQITYSAAPPSSGTWSAGDRVFNSAPSIGQPKSWVCTVGGTPGTWVSEGPL